MSRAPFQVLVIPYFILSPSEILYAVFRRLMDGRGCWQAIAGGGEDDETPEQAARREAWEEAGIEPHSDYLALNCMAMIPVVNVAGFSWGENVLVIPEYCFGVQAPTRQLRLSGEHLECRWLAFEDAHAQLTWDSNKNALWELNHRLRRPPQKRRAGEPDDPPAQ